MSYLPTPSILISYNNDFGWTPLHDSHMFLHAFYIYFCANCTYVTGFGIEIAYAACSYLFALSLARRHRLKMLTLPVHLA